jgi:hypothetical protein
VRRACGRSPPPPIPIQPPFPTAAAGAARCLVLATLPPEHCGDSPSPTDTGSLERTSPITILTGPRLHATACGKEPNDSDVIDRPRRQRAKAATQLARKKNIPRRTLQLERRGRSHGTDTPLPAGRPARGWRERTKREVNLGCVRLNLFGRSQQIFS